MADDKKIVDEISGTETTGHEWDGIKELNTPMPRWWLGLLYLCIVWAVIYAILMPSIPLIKGHFKGVLGHSDRASVVTELEALHAMRADNFARLGNVSIKDLRDPKNADLFDFTLAAGKSAFGDNCATCHGTGAQGFDGYPNLNDDVWIWGGTFKDIRQTLNVGIRAGHEDTRTNSMMAYGRDEILSKAQIKDVAAYVYKLSGQSGHGYDHVDLAKGKTIFAEQCASCHGETGMGDREQGAPNLTDTDWLYGGEIGTIYNTIYNGRAGVMPNWNERLSPEMVTALAVYVHALGGGEYESDTQ
jgi:cytochrome c oxidase cbb3-type subunit 3